MKKNIAVIAGDGIGPEIMAEALKALNCVQELYGHQFDIVPVCAGGCAIDQYGTSLPEESLQKCLDSDSVLLGAVGGPKWDGVDPAIRPEKALLTVRKALGLYANLRPAKIFPQLKDASPLKPELVENGIDFMVVRELISGVYFGEKKTEERDGELYASDNMCYYEHEIRRIAHTAFQTARKRHGRVTSVDKANVLDTSRLWRKVVHEVAQEYPDVQLQDMLVDNAAMQIVKNPAQFDVIVTENMFGDILTDEASVISGSLGMLSSASIGAKCALFEPVHGSYPQAAGKDIANPMAAVLSAALLLEHLGLGAEGRAVRKAIDRTLAAGVVTEDLTAPGQRSYRTSAVGDFIAAQI